MDKTHPNRKRDKYNPYTLQIRKDRYFITFKDGTDIYHEIEIEERLYMLFNRFELEDISHINKYNRYIEHLPLTDEILYHRALYPKESLEDAMTRYIDNERLRNAIAELSETQKRRLVLHFFEGLTYKEIAEKEGCTIMPVKRSIDSALKKIKNFFE